MSDEVVIGKFGRPHGVRGEVRFFPYNPETELLDEGRTLRLSKCSLDSVTIVSVRFADKFDIVRLDGIDSREDAERLRNVEASVARSELPEPDEDEFYLVDVVGFEVWAAQRAGEERRKIGKLKGWLDIGPNDLMAVTGPEIKGRMLGPYLDHTVETIDFDAQRVLLMPLDTWLAED